jgi:hypothetical protein
MRKRNCIKGVDWNDCRAFIWWAAVVPSRNITHAQIVHINEDIDEFSMPFTGTFRHRTKVGVKLLRLIKATTPHPKSLVVDAIKDFHRREMYMSRIRDICLGKSYIREKGILHSDLKTKCLLLSDSLVVKTADFGLSRYVDTINDGPEYTLVGTPFLLRIEKTAAESWVCMHCTKWCIFNQSYGGL